MSKGKFLLAAVLILMAACTRSQKIDTSQAAPAVSARESIRIYFIPKNMGNPYFDAVSTGFYNAIAELGAEKFDYTYFGPDTAEVDSQVEYLERALQAGADAIFIAPNSSDALNEVFDRVRAAGIRLYSINQDIPGSESHRDAAIMPVNFDSIGAAQVELLAAQMRYEGDFAILSATEDAPDQKTWVQAMQAALKDPKYRRMRLLGVVYGDDQDEKSKQEMAALIGKYPNLKGVIAPTAVGLPAACELVRQRGLSGKIKVTGLGLPSSMAEFVADGTCEGFELWNPPYEGYIAVYMVWAEKNSGFAPQPGASFTAGHLGEHSVLPNGQILTLETPMLYDKSNIGEYSILF